MRLQMKELVGGLARGFHGRTAAVAPRVDPAEARYERVRRLGIEAVSRALARNAARVPARRLVRPG